MWEAIIKLFWIQNIKLVQSVQTAYCDTFITAHKYNLEDNGGCKAALFIAIISIYSSKKQVNSRILTSEYLIKVHLYLSNTK